MYKRQALWGIRRAGAVPVLIDPDRGLQGVIAHLEATDARALIVADDYADAADREELTAQARARGLGVIPMTDQPLGEGDLIEPRDLGAIHRLIRPDDTAVVLCTSGTVPYTHLTLPTIYSV